MSCFSKFVNQIYYPLNCLKNGKGDKNTHSSRTFIHQIQPGRGRNQTRNLKEIKMEPSQEGTLSHYPSLSAIKQTKRTHVGVTNHQSIQSLMKKNSVFK